jgi:hypothetical protein
VLREGHGDELSFGAQPSLNGGDGSMHGGRREAFVDGVARKAHDGGEIVREGSS